MANLVAPFLFIAVVLYIAYPLLREGGGQTPALDSQSEWDLAVQEKDDLIANLKDIDMDYRMGKLSPQDYQALKNDFEQRAVLALQRLESMRRKKRSKKKS